MTYIYNYIYTYIYLRSHEMSVNRDATAKDQELLQTFGSFLDLQLLPLYVRDVPLEYVGEAAWACF